MVFIVAGVSMKQLSLQDLAFGFDLRITGSDKRFIKEYIAETLHGHLTREYEEK